MEFEKNELWRYPGIRRSGAIHNKKTAMPIPTLAGQYRGRSESCRGQHT